jgi:hypothetical protein
MKHLRIPTQADFAAVIPPRSRAATRRLHTSLPLTAGPT